MEMKLCDCGGLCNWNSYFQKWLCDKCKVCRTDREMNVVTQYLDLKFEQRNKIQDLMKLDEESGMYE